MKFKYSIVTPMVLFMLFSLFISKQNVTAQNNAVLFDGTGDYLGIPDNSAIQFGTNDFTLGFWITLTDLTRVHDGLFGRNDFQWIAMEYNADNDRRLNLWIDANGSSNWELNNLKPSKNDWIANTWYHIAVQRKSNTINIFINGDLAASASYSSTIFNPAGIPLYLGRSQLASRNHKGLIDDLRIWNYAIDPVDLKSSISQDFTGREPGLAACYKFNEVSGLTAFDSTPNAVNATLYGDASFATSTSPVSSNIASNAAFSPVLPTGLPYNIVISSVTMDGAQLPVGAQIAVYDGSLCVGASVYKSPGNIQIVAWKKDPTQGLTGYTTGNQMNFKIRTSWLSEERIFNATPSFSVGDNTFGYGLYSVASLSVSTGFTSAIRLSDQTLNFGICAINTTVAKTFTIFNDGNSILKVSGIQSGSTNFTVSKSGTSIAPGSSEAITVSFLPVQIVDYTSTLTITSDAAGNETKQVVLHGTGIAAPSPVLQVTPSNLNFGGVTLGSGNVLKVNVLNTGNGALSITNITSSNPVFIVDNPAPFNLEQNQNKDILVRFQPSANGNWNGNLSIQTNAGTKTITLTGIATQGYFVPVVSTGLPYNIVVQNAEINQQPFKNGDEIAVFDNSLCVGSTVIDRGGKALDLDGTNSYMSIPTGVWFAGDFTFETWVYLRSYNNWSRLFDFGNGAASNNILSYLYPNTGRLYFETYNNNLSGGAIFTPAALPLNQWIHVACVLKGNTGSIFLNGISVVSGNMVFPLNVNRTNNYIGKSNWSGDYYLNAMVDEVRIWNYARTGNDIVSNMNKSLSGKDAGLTGYWNFESGSAKDASLSGKNGSLNGNAMCVTGGAVPGSILVTAWQKDPSLNQNGFTTGNPITYKFRTTVFDSLIVKDATPNYIIGDGKFGFTPYTVVNLSATVTKAPKIELSDSKLYVGQILVNTSAKDTFYVRNKGNAILNVGLSEQSAAFSLSVPEGSIKAGDSLRVIVTFAPTVTGSHVINININSNDATNPQLILRTEGFALPSGTPGIGSSVQALSFNGCKNNSTKELTFNVINTGTTPLVVSNITSTNAQFTISPVSFTLSKTNDVKEIKVVFKPVTKGAITGTVNITSNAPVKQLQLNGVGFDGHFTNITPTGLPYNIVVTETNISPYLKVGDEIAVFDDTLCVGTSAIEQSSGNIQVVAWKADPKFNLPGFTDGHQMKFRVWTNVNGIASEFSASPYYLIGNGNFGFGQFSVIKLDCSVPDISVSSTDIFAAVKLPNEITKNITVTNEGAAPLVYQIVELPAVDWLSENILADTLAPGESADVLFTFKSAGLVDGKYQTTLNVINNSPNKSPVVVPAALNVTGLQQIEVIPVSGVFKNTEVGKMDTLTFSVRNTGTAPLTINNIAFAGNKPEFGLSRSYTYPLVIQPMENINLKVIFSPVAAVIKTDSLVITSNASNANSLYTAISGKGLTPPHIFVRRSAISLQMNTGELFADSLYIKNAGQGVLTFSLTKNVSWFLAQPISGSLNAGDSIKIKLNISAYGLGTGTFISALSIASNDLDKSLLNIPITIAVKGTKIIQTADILNFGDVPVNTVLREKQAIKNNGSDTLTINAITNSAGAFFVNASFPRKIAPGKTDSVEVVFSPNNINSFSDVMVVTSDAGNTSSVQVVLQGKGILPPVLLLSTDTLRVTVPSGTIKTLPLTFTNNGNETLVYSVSLLNSAKTSLSLNGNGDYVNVLNADGLNPDSTLTIEAWIYPEDNTNEFIVAKELNAIGPYRLYIDNFGKLAFTINGAYTLTSGATIEKSHWNHVAAVFDINKMSLYINGIKNCELNIPATKLNKVADNLRIGRSYQNEYFKGKIEELKIWKIARSVYEINSAYRQTLSGLQDGLSLYFKFDETSTNIVFDSSTKGINGTLYGNATRQPSSLNIDDIASINLSGGSIDAYQSSNLEISVSSGAQFARVYKKEFQIKSNDPQKPTVIIPLFVTISGNPVIDFSSTSLSFRNTFAGYVDTALLTIFNHGASDLYISNLQFSKSDFSMEKTITHLSPFTQTATKLFFKPATTGLIQGTLIATNNSENAASSIITLSGTGLEPPVFNTAITSLNFGGVPIGIKKDTLVRVTNKGKSPLVISSILLSNAGTFTLTTYPSFTLNENEYRDIAIRFAPKAFLMYNSNLIFNTNVGARTIPVAGNGVTPAYDLELNAILSPTDGCNLSANVPVTVRIKNSGNKVASGFDLAFKIDDQNYVVENVGATSIQPQQYLEYTFNKKADVSLLGNHTFHCFASMANDPNTANDSMMVVINNYNKLKIKISSNVLLCRGESAQLTASGASQYIWSNGATTSSITVSPVSNTVYKVTASDAYGCQTSDSVKAIIKPLPPVPFIHTTNPAHICDGDTLRLFADITVTGDSVSIKQQLKNSLLYSWLYNTNTWQGYKPINNAHDTLLDVTVNNDYKIMVTNSYGCTSTSVSQFAEVTPKAQVTNKPLLVQACNDELSGAINLTSTSATAIFSWTAIAPSTLSGYVSSGDGPIPAQTLSTQANYPDTLKYTIIPSDKGCTGISSVLTIVVNHPVVPGVVSDMMPDSAVNLQYPVVLSWSPGVNANKYDLYIWEANSQEPNAPYIKDFDGISVSINNGLKYGTLYKWKVVSNNYCASSESAVKSFKIRYLPNIEIVNAQGSGTGFSGQEAGVKWQIKNIGLGETYGSGWNDVVFLSSDSTLDIGIDYELARISNLSALVPGQEYAQSVNVNLPNGISGKYYFIIYTDRYNQLLETSKTDNISTPVAIQVTLTPPPDLQVDDIITPFNTYSGMVIPVTWQVKNEGLGSALTPAWNDAVYLSKDSILNFADAKKLGEFTHSGLLEPDSIYKTTQNVTIPVSIVGNYFIYIVTDINNKVYEHASESNNSLRSNKIEITLTPPADLVPTGIVYESSVANGQQTTVEWSVENQGINNAEGNWTDRIYLSKDKILNKTSATSLGAVMHSGLTAGDTYSESVEITIPEIAPGQYYIFVNTDDANAVFEYDQEANNAMSFPVTIQTPDLVAKSITYPTLANSGDSISFKWVITNKGNGASISHKRKDAVYVSLNPTYTPNQLIKIGEISFIDQIAVNDSVVKTKNFKIPDGISGNFYVYLVVDAENSIFENGIKSNNILKGKTFLGVTLSPWVNLKPTSITSPHFAKGGDNISLSYKVKNAGTRVATGTWIDRLYISRWPIFKSDSTILLTEYAVEAPVPIDSSYQLTDIPIELPRNLSEGPYYFFLNTDVNNALYEYQYEDDNVLKSEVITISAYPPCDLEVKTLAVPAQANSGNTVAMNANVINNSIYYSRVGFWYDEIYISPTETYNPSTAILIKRFSRNSPLGANASYSITDQIRIPDGISGNMYLIYKTDVNRVNLETNVLNNMIASPIQIILTPPADLKAISVSTQYEQYAGQPVNIIWKAVNQGTGSTGGEWIDKIYLSDDISLSNDDILLGSVTHNGAILPGAAYNDSLRLFIPQNLRGHKVVIVNCNGFKKFYETSYENNKAVTTLLIKEPLPCDLVPESISLPSEALVGDQISVTWDLKNNGANPAFGFIRQAVYLSKDTVWDVNDKLFGTLESNINIAPQSTSSFKVTEKLENVSIGDHYAFVFTDMLDNFLESNEENNKNFSMFPIHVEVPELPIGVSFTRAFYNNIDLYYKINVPDSLVGEAALISILGDTLNGNNQMYIKYGDMPTLAINDFAANNPFEGKQEIIIPALQKGNYYLTISGNNTVGSMQNLKISTKKMIFEIHAINANNGGNSGLVTCEVIGSKFNDMTRLFLEGTDRRIDADTVVFVNNTKVFATFDLSNAAPEVYNVVANNICSGYAILDKGFTIENAMPADLQINVIQPSSTVAGSAVTVMVEFFNGGNTDIYNPVIEINSSATPISLTMKGLKDNVKTLNIPLGEQIGKYKILRAGYRGSIVFYSVATGGLGFFINYPVLQNRP